MSSLQIRIVKAFLVFAVLCLACKPLYAFDLFGVRQFPGQLIEIDSSSGGSSLVGSTGINAIYGLAFDSTSDTLFGNDVINNRLVSVDRTTGATTAIGATTGVDLPFGLAFDSSTNKLFSFENQNNQLFEIDRFTGSGTAIGAVGFNLVADIAYDSVNDTLFGVDSIGNRLISINRSTGLGTVVGGQFGISPNVNILSLAFDSSSNTLFGVDADSNQLVTIDRTTGAAAIVGSIGPGNALTGLEFLPPVIVSVPEPTSALLFGIAAVGLGLVRRRRN